MRASAGVSVIWRVVAAVAFVVSATPLWCQVVQLSGGASSLSQSQGGTVTLRGQSYSASLGGGVISGHVYGGAQLSKRTESSTFTLGTETIPFNLPTDIFDSDHYLTGVGAGVTTRLSTARLRAFLGETSTQFDSPFFVGARGGQKAALMSFTANLTPRVVEATNAILSNKITLINSVAWNSGDGVKVAASAGVGSSQPYGATSLWVTRPHLELKAAYYAAGSQFRRADVPVPVSSEAARENILVTYRPLPRLTFTAGRQNYLSPVYGSETNIRSTVNQVSGSLEAAGYLMSGSLLQSTYSNIENASLILSLGKQFGPRLSVQQTLLANRPDNSNSTFALVTNIQETLSPRWGLSQVINNSGGNNTVGFGGSFLSNIATLSAEYQTYYVPARPENPFEQALILNAEIHALNRVTLNGATFVSPTGKLLYTVSAQSAVSRQAPESDAGSEHHTWGRAALRGRVVDTQGRPIMGAALNFDGLAVYSDSDGFFYVREQKPRWHGVKVMTDQFLDGYQYRVVSAPVTIRTTVNEVQNDTLVVVEPVSASER